MVRDHGCFPRSRVVLTGNGEQPWNRTGSSRAPAAREGDKKKDEKLPENSKKNLDKKLDHALEETFPTSDPISVKITK